jgi:hypothetical protein
MHHISFSPRWAALVLLVALPGCLQSGGPSLPPAFDGPGASPDIPEMDGGDIDRVSFDLLLNEEREGGGLLRVTENSILSTASQDYAVDMHENGYFSHTGRDGSSAGDRATAAGYQWSYISENLASGYKTEGGVIDAWMDSPGHEANMMDERAEDFGIGRAGDTWVLMLGAQR